MEVEAIFGQIKCNKGYKRFRHTGLDKIIMDFGIMSIVFNIGKMINKRENAKKGRQWIEYKNNKKGKMGGVIVAICTIDSINHKKCTMNRKRKRESIRTPSFILWNLDLSCAFIKKIVITDLVTVVFFSWELSKQNYYAKSLSNRY